MATLVGLAAVGMLALAFPASEERLVNLETAGPAATTDARTFEAVVARVRAGASYYPAMGIELRARDYPTGSLFNWRTPLHLVALSTAPWFVWRGVLSVLLVGFFVGTLVATRQSVTAARVAGFMAVGVLIVESAPDAVYVNEAWAGVLIGVSVCAYALGRAGLGVAAALLALFIRELAAPYCVACGVIAIANRRWREVATWAGGATLYFGYFAWHAYQVAGQRLPGDVPHATSWLQFGGLPFLQATLHSLGWLALARGWFDALALVAIIGGIVNRAAPPHVRAASAVFVAFFLVFGQWFNSYWGWLAAPSWALACGYGAVTVMVAARGVASGTLSRRMRVG